MLNHHIIFEGAELAGKSWLMSQIYNYLEPKYNSGGYLLDGCHWFNCDVGVYGTKHGRPIIKSYLKIFKELKNSNLLIENSICLTLFIAACTKRKKLIIEKLNLS